MPEHTTTEIHTALLFDRHHEKVGIVKHNITTGHVEEYQINGTPFYMQLGSGNETFVATTAIDAFTLHMTNLSQRTISPIKIEELADVCNSLLLNAPDSEFRFLAETSQNNYVAIAKRNVNGSSDYHDYNYSNWTDQYKELGLEAVEKYILRTKEETEAVDKYLVTDDHVQGIENQRAIFDNLIINQHITVICAAPNAGKTTILNWVSSQISEVNDVRFINMDCSGAAMKEYQQYAKDNGFEFINFDITNTNTDDFFSALNQTSDLRGTVYIIDTLKKVADPMKKDGIRNFMKMLRGLCIKGATFVLLAHTNKHKDKEGKPIFEGVGDVRADCDELIYLIPETNKDRTLTVSTLPDKKRALIEPITFLIDQNRNVSLTDYVDTIGNHRKSQDEAIIQTIESALAKGLTIQSELVECCQSSNFGKHHAIKILERYSKDPTQLWARAKGAHNAWLYKQI